MTTPEQPTTTAPLRVTVWGENRHEQRDQRVRDLYPDGMHGAIRAGIEENPSTASARRRSRRPMC